jgi:glycosyltransferase involved in cell wall biosynthesis
MSAAARSEREEMPLAAPSMPVITTIIPVFNRATTVRRAIDSVLGQEAPSGCSVKIIVVDDASSDDLAASLQPYGDSVTCIRHTCNSGPASARNTGIAAAREGYVAFLDSDDVWLPGKLTAQLGAMRTNNWLASATAFYLARAGRPDTVSPRYRSGPLDLSALVWGCFVSPGSTLVCARSVFDEVGTLDTRLRRLEDWDWLLRYARKYPLGFIAEPLARVSPSQHKEADKVITALEILRSEHLPGLTGEYRRHFLAAMEMELAAAQYRRGNMLAMIGPLLKSLLRVPVRNDALAAVLHNRR